MAANAAISAYKNELNRFALTTGSPVKSMHIEIDINETGANSLVNIVSGK